MPLFRISTGNEENNMGLDWLNRYNGRPFLFLAAYYFFCLCSVIVLLQTERSTLTVFHLSFRYLLVSLSLSAKDKYGSRVESLTHLQTYINICQVAIVSMYVLSMVDVVRNTLLYIGSSKGVYFSYLNTFCLDGLWVLANYVGYFGAWAKIIIDISLIFFQQDEI
jgi:hypothetical protein